MSFDPLDKFVEVFNKTAAEAAKEAVTSGLKEAGFSEVVVGVSAAMSQALAEQLLGPQLRVLLKMIDPTQKKLDSILEEPLRTGGSPTRQAMMMQVITAADAALRQQHFYNALISLEKAYTYARNRNIFLFRTLRISRESRESFNSVGSVLEMRRPAALANSRQK